MKSKTAIVFVIAIFIQAFTYAASVDTINIFSKAMKVSKKCVVILPDSYQNQNNSFPVLYLLHGYSGDYANWIQKVPEIKNYADKFQMIIVCPDGDYNSWYVDSPVDSTRKYDTYISIEVPHYIDSAYSTLADRKYRAITGLSMGGHGALSLAWKHPEIFGAAGSMSGVQNLVPWKTKYELNKVLGDTTADSVFSNYSVITLVKKLPAKIPALIIDCGVDDPFIETNRQLHQELLQLKVPHDYTERNGAHTWQYWKNSVGYHCMFFHKFFHAVDK
jgi:S-formylglutathione hydrolase FrmB